MPTLQKLGRANTAITRDRDGFKVLYHSTPVVTVKDKGIVLLNTGGWFTQTTKTRMNQAARQFNLGYNVFQKAGRWFVHDGKGAVIPFQNGLAVVGV